MTEFNITHHFAPKVYARQSRLKRGKKAATHKHKFDHMSILARGVARVEVDGKETTYVGPTAITILAGKVHTITAVTNIDWFCVHATEVTDAALIDHELIEEN